MPWFQTMLCNLDQGEKCQHHATPSEFPGQLTDWPEWFEPHKPGQNETVDEAGLFENNEEEFEQPNLQDCLNSDPGSLPEGCLWLINNAFNEVRKYICPGYIRPTQDPEADSRQAKLLATVLLSGFVNLKHYLSMKYDLILLLKNPLLGARQFTNKF